MFHATRNIFSIFEVRNYPSIYDFGLEVSPKNAISEGIRQASPLQLELESGSFRYRRYVSGIENDLDQKFYTSNFF